MQIGFFIAIITVVLWFAIRFFVKRWTEKFLRNAWMKKTRIQKTFRIKSMHGIRDKYKLERLINGIENVYGRVHLKNETVTVCYGENISDEMIKKLIENAGLSMVEVKNL